MPSVAAAIKDRLSTILGRCTFTAWVNPTDGRLYVATHTGLYRIDSPDSATRIGDRYQDTMGFTIAGPDRFLASGHPDLRDDTLQQADKPPLLGLVASSDKGQTWQPISLLGDADLHTLLTVGDEIVAYDSTGQRVLVSQGGVAWQTRSSIALTDLAVDPADIDRMVALSAAGATLISTDGGRTWSKAAAGPTLAVLRWAGTGLWAGAADGGLYRFDASTGGWTATWRFDGAIEALFIEQSAIYVAVEGFGVYRSPDGHRQLGAALSTFRRLTRCRRVRRPTSQAFNRPVAAGPRHGREEGRA